MPGDLQTFLRDYPEVRISLDERLSHNIVAAVAEGRADVGVVTWDDEHPELVFLPYRQDEVVMVVPEGDPLAARQSVAFLDSPEPPLRQLCKAGRPFIPSWWARPQLWDITMDVRIQVSGFAAVVAMVRSGAGIGMVPRSVLQSINCDGVRAVDAAREVGGAATRKLCTRRNAAASAVYVGALLRQLGQQADAPGDKLAAAQHGG
ncbi:LysR substrate-binding domain-containing protein [Cupriavidus basilensis]